MTGKKVGIFAGHMRQILNAAEVVTAFLLKMVVDIILITCLSMNKEAHYYLNLLCPTALYE